MKTLKEEYNINEGRIRYKIKIQEKKELGVYCERI